MRRGFLTFLLILGGLYLVLHLILGSSPVQRRVLEEVRTALTKFGLDLKIESIEFSALTPKIYLNRVTLSSTPHAVISFPEPIAIDKIKLEFQPLALIYRQIIIEELTLFHPRIILPQADRLYHRLSRLIAEKKRVEVQSGGFKLVVKKIGVVDALFNIVSHDPAFAVRSRSFSAYLQNSISQQQNITVDSTDLEIERGKLMLDLTRLDVDVDLTKKSIRVNRGIVEGPQLGINLKATSSLPFREGKGPESLNASFDLRVPLRLLERFPELKLPRFSGGVATSGTVALEDGVATGRGRLSYEGLAVEDYKLGSGSLAFSLAEKKLNLSEVDLRYGGGEVRSAGLRLELHDRFPISGDLQLHDVKLEGILDSLKAGDTPIRMRINGPLKASGFLLHPLEITGDLKDDFAGFVVVKNERKETTDENTILGVKQGSVEGSLKFTEDRMAFQAVVDILGGKITTDGFVGFDNIAKIHAQGDALSLSQLKRISSLRVGGRTNVLCDIDVKGKDARVSGKFDITSGEVADVVLGTVKGEAYFRDALLSFENLELPSIEPIHGNGFVDFHPKKTHYRFTADARRADLNQVFNSLQRIPLSFGVPNGGELSARMTLEGEEESIRIDSSGSAKNFTWKGERWASSTYDLTYRPDSIDLTRLMLFKKSGGAELHGHFTKKDSTVGIQSHGLRLEEFDLLGRAPLAGELVGEVTLDGNLSQGPIKGSGEVRLSKASYRGNPLPDSVFNLRTQDGQVEFLGNVVGQKLRARYVMPLKPKEPAELLVYFQDFDFGPLATLWLGKDIATLSDLTATGDFSLKGSFSEWKSLRGSGSITSLYLGFRGTPMKNKQPLEVKIENGAVKVPRFNLSGVDSQVSLDFEFEPEKYVRASLDGKLDLQFLQPFIPGLEYGTGQVTVGLRVSGRPSSYELLGNVLLEDATFRLIGLKDEFRSTRAQLSVSQDRVNVDHFESVVNGGALTIDGDVRINRFHSLIPNLLLNANHVQMKLQNSLATTFSGDFFIRGSSQPYSLGGRCRIIEAELTRLETGAASTISDGPPLFNLNVNCDARDHLYVNTDVLKAEFRGSLNLLGTTSKPGLTGNLEAITESKTGHQGYIFFRETRFDLDTGTVNFESPTSIAPRFTVSGSTLVKEQKLVNPQQYQVGLQVVGTPEEYKIRLTSTPALLESDIISLLLLGVTNRGNNAEGGAGFDFAGAIANQIPLQSLLQKELGVGISMTTQPTKAVTQPTGSTTSPTANDYTTVPRVKVQKDITNKTKLSFSNTIGETQPSREIKIEHILDEHFSVNGTAADGPTRDTIETPANPSIPSYGIDLRYRFEFE